jgi:hypothetical protein
MEAKEKAIELIYRYNSLIAKNTKFTSDSELKKSKQCVLIAVDEILLFIDESDFINLFWLNYWQEVKKEINKL